MYSTKDVLVKKSELESETSHQQGATASFAIKETFDKIYAKLESAERKQTLGFGKKVQEKKTVNDFEPIQEDQEESEEEFRKPVSGRSSRSMKKAAPKTPVRQEAHDEDLLQSQGIETPSILGSSAQ